MPNPLSDRGVTDRDYAAMVGTLVGEAAVKGTLQDYQAIADVIANRLNDKNFVSQYGKSIAAQTMNPKEFSTWSPKEVNAYQNAKAGFMASLNPAVANQMPAAMRERVNLAQQAVNDVMVSGKARGVAQGATFYDNPAVTAKLGTGGFHNRLEDQYGSTMIGAHRFSGPDFTDQPFDPVTYNGQLAAPAAAIPDTFTDIGLPAGQVDFMGELPDPALSAPPIGQVDFAGYLDAPQQPAQAGFSMTGDQFNGVFDAGFPAQAAAAPMDMGTFNDIQAAGFGETFGPSLNEMGQPQEAGVVAGLDSGPWGQTPDFNAPSLDQRNAETLAQDRINAFERDDLWSKPSSIPQDQINANVMAELTGQTVPFGAQPLQAATTTTPPQAASPNLANAPMGDFGMADMVAAPQATTAPQTHSLSPSSSLPETGPLPPERPKETFSLGPVGYSDLGLTVGGWASPVDAVTSSLGFGSGLLDGTIGRTLTGAGTGFLTGGLPGAAIGGLLSGTGWGDMMKSQLGDFLGTAWDHMSQGWGGYDFDTHGYGVGFNSRGERSPTGPNDRGDATMGDGSWGERSGTNPNNPQGIY